MTRNSLENIPKSYIEEGFQIFQLNSKNILSLWKSLSRATWNSRKMEVKFGNSQERNPMELMEVPKSVWLNTSFLLEIAPKAGYGIYGQIPDGKLILLRHSKNQ